MEGRRLVDALTADEGTCAPEEALDCDLSESKKQPRRTSALLSRRMGATRGADEKSEGERTG